MLAVNLTDRIDLLIYNKITTSACIAHLQGVNRVLTGAKLSSVASSQKPLDESTTMEIRGFVDVGGPSQDATADVNQQHWPSCLRGR